MLMTPTLATSTGTVGIGSLYTEATAGGMPTLTASLLQSAPTTHTHAHAHAHTTHTTHMPQHTLLRTLHPDHATSITSAVGPTEYGTTDEPNGTEQCHAIPTTPYPTPPPDVGSGYDTEDECPNSPSMPTTPRQGALAAEPFAVADAAVLQRQRRRGKEPFDTDTASRQHPADAPAQHASKRRPRDPQNARQLRRTSRTQTHPNDNHHGQQNQDQHQHHAPPQQQKHQQHTKSGGHGAAGAAVTTAASQKLPGATIWYAAVRFIASFSVLFRCLTCQRF